jgi:hypothetical protein
MFGSLTNIIHFILVGGHLHILHADRLGVLLRHYDICYPAARNGHLEVIKWAREREFDWNEKKSAAAAAGGTSVC